MVASPGETRPITASRKHATKQTIKTKGTGPGLRRATNRGRLPSPNCGSGLLPGNAPKTTLCVRGDLGAGKGFATHVCELDLLPRRLNRRRPARQRSPVPITPPKAEGAGQTPRIKGPGLACAGRRIVSNTVTCLPEQEATTRAAGNGEASRQEKAFRHKAPKAPSAAGRGVTSMSTDGGDFITNPYDVARA